MGKQKTLESGLISVVVGICVALLICLMLVGVCAQMLLTEKIGEGSMNLAVTLIVLISSFLGSLLGGLLRKKKVVAITMATSGGMLAMMVLAGLIVDGQFSNAIHRMGAVVVGGIVSCVICLKKRTKTTRRKSAYR